MNPTTHIKNPAYPTDWANPITHVRAPQPQTLRTLLGAVALVSVAALSSCIPQAAHAQFMTGGALLENMEAQEDNRRIAAAFYVAGVFDAYKDMVHCAPRAVTLAQVHDLLRSFLTANPQLQKQQADIVAGALFSRAWPCETKQQGPSV